MIWSSFFSFKEDYAWYVVYFLRYGVYSRTSIKILYFLLFGLNMNFIWSLHYRLSDLRKMKICRVISILLFNMRLARKSFIFTFLHVTKLLEGVKYKWCSNYCYHISYNSVFWNIRDLEVVQHEYHHVLTLWP